MTALLLSLALLFSVPAPISFADRHMLWLVNHERQEAGLPLLRGSTVLYAEAAKRSRDNARLGKIDHRMPSSGYFWDDLNRIGFRYREAGEDLGLWTGPDVAVAEPAVTRLLMASPPHREIILGDWVYGGASATTINGSVWITVLVSR